MCLRNSTLLFLFLALLTAGFCIPLAGQGYVLTHYRSMDGIGHDNVRTIVADSSGFIWMATWDGLTRYDGTEFVNYHHDPADSTSLPYFSVNHVVVDILDNLWITTDNRVLSQFNRATEEFISVTSLGGVQLNDLSHFCQGGDGYLWFLLRKGILKYHPDTEEVILYNWRNSNGEMPRIPFLRYRLTFSQNGDPWLTGPDIIKAELEEDEATGSHYAIIKNIYPLERLPGRIGFFFNDAGASRIVSDAGGKLWLAAMTGLFSLDTAEGIFREYGSDLKNLKFTTRSPVAFYNHESGLNIWHPATDTILTIPNDICALPITCFFHEQGIMWISRTFAGNTPGGVIKAVFTQTEFRHINPLPLKSSEINIFGLIEDEDGALWIAARDRNYLIRTDRNGVSSKINPLNNDELKDFWHPRSFLPVQGALWIGYYFNKLVRYDLRSGKMEEHYPAEYVHTTCYDKDGRILIADSGIIRYDPSSRSSEKLLSIEDSINIFTFHRHENILWAGCNYSYLLRYDLETGDHELIRIARAVMNIEDICEGNDGVLWLATLGSGVCRYDPSTGERYFYTTASGLSNNTTYSILKDRHSNLWVSTNDGLSVINPFSGLIRTFGENDGLLIHEFNSDAAWATDDGRFLFGGVGGAVEFDPVDILKAQQSIGGRKIIILGMQVSAENRVFEEPVYKADTIILNKGEDNFRLSFVVPEYRHPEMIRYRYRLGVEDNWFYTDHNDRNINYSNMIPGWHHLEIQATDISGSWSNVRTLVIRLKPYFYQTMAFRITAPLALLLLAALLSWISVKQYRQRERQKKDELKHQALRGQMNPHFIFNALNSINYFISNNDRLAANRFIADFSKLIRTVLNNMNEDFVRLSVEMGALEDYLKIEHLRFGDKFDYSVNIEPGLQTDSISVSPGLIQPFVENAIWHGVMGLTDRKGIISVSLHMRDGVLVCRVDDDGVGRARSEAMKDRSLPGGKSKGISLTTDRLKIINNLLLTNYKITISDLFSDRFETGTRVEIEMPVAN